MSQGFGASGPGDYGYSGPSGFGGVPSGGGGDGGAGGLGGGLGGGLPDRSDKKIDLLWGYELLKGDPDWVKKTLLLALVMFIPVVGGFIVQGWLGYATRRAMAGHARPFLDWSFDMPTMMELLKLGFVRTVVGMIWGIPAGIVLVVALAMMGVAFWGIAAIGGDSSVTTLGMACCSFVGGLSFSVLMLAMNVLPTAAKIRVDLTGRLGAGLEVSEVMAAGRAMLGKGWLLNVIVFAFAVSTAFFLLSLVAIGPLVVPAFAMLIGNFVGLAVYRKALAAGVAVPTLGPLDPPTGA